MTYKALPDEIQGGGLSELFHHRHVFCIGNYVENLDVDGVNHED